MFVSAKKGFQCTSWGRLKNSEALMSPASICSQEELFSQKSISGRAVTARRKYAATHAPPAVQTASSAIAPALFLIAALIFLFRMPVLPCQMVVCLLFCREGKGIICLPSGRPSPSSARSKARRA